jgi:hypothetical protein
MLRIKYLLLIAIFFAPSVLRAQINEGVLLSTQLLPSESRGAAMGGNLISAADGIDALDYNPAALAPMTSREFTFSGFNRDYNSSADFFGMTSKSQFDAGAFSSVGIASPYPTVQGHFALGISFDRVRDYTSAYSFSAVNPNSSFLNTQGFLQDPGVYGNHNQGFLLSNNLAYALGLTYQVPDTGKYMLATPFGGGMLQSGNVTTEGGLNAVRIGGGMDIAPGISLGATINILFGTYDFIENYQETDPNGVLAKDTVSNGIGVPINSFQAANVTTTLHQNQSGGSLKLGLLVDEHILKFGLTVESPQVLHIDESSQQIVTSQFGGYEYVSENAFEEPVYSQSYDIVTPWKFGVGGSVHISGLTGQASVSYINMSDLQFTNSTFDMSALNTYASDSLRGVLSWSLGAEYKFPSIGLAIRAGYSFESSPYVGDPSNFGISAFSAGLGIPLGHHWDLDLAWRHETYTTNHSIYNDYAPDGTTYLSSNINSDAVSRDDISLTLNYRY